MTKLLYIWLRVIFSVQQSFPARKALLTNEVRSYEKARNTNRLTSSPVATKLGGGRSDVELSEQVGESKDQIRRYIRLTNLVPELLEYVDEGRIKMRPAVELSYLDEDSQRDVVEQIDINDCTPSHDQTIRMRKMFESGKLTAEAVEAIMSEENPTSVSALCCVVTEYEA